MLDSFSLAEKVNATTALPVTVGNIPAELCARDRWVTWKYEAREDDVTKIPYIATSPHQKASSTDLTTWRSFHEALASYEDGKADGIGYILVDGIVGIDLDDCRNPESGTIAEWATAIINIVDSSE